MEECRYLDSIEKAIEKAEEQDCDVIMGYEHDLLLDFDVPKTQSNVRMVSPPGQYFKMLEILNNNGVHCQESERWQSHGGAGLHIVVKLEKPLPAYARLALQCAMGSDPKRELLGVVRVINGIDQPSLLFKPRKKQ